MAPQSCLIVSPDAQTCAALSSVLMRHDLAPASAESVNAAWAVFSNTKLAVVLTGEELPDGDFRDVVRISKANICKTPVIVFSHLADWDRYLRVLASGAFDYVRYPWGSGELERVVQNALSLAFVEKARAAVSGA